MDIQRLYSYIRQAVDQYEMIEEGDKIAIGVSGGKDSLTLLYGLSGLRRFYPRKFDICAVTVDLGYDGFDTTQIERLCQKLDVEYHVVHTRINEMIENGSCSLCARLRKGALNEAIMKLGCNKIAYAHNMDDVVETMMLSLIYEGRFSTFWPVTYFEDTKLTLIRPMMLVPKNRVLGFSKKYELPVSKNPCPYESHTQRKYVRELLDSIEKHAPGTTKRMMSAIRNGNMEGWRSE